MLRFSENITTKPLVNVETALPAVATEAAVLPAETTVEDPALTPFLDEIVRHLDVLPTDMHSDIRRELRVHLESLIDAHEELGATRDEAIVAAMRQFGDSRQIARRYRQAWRSADGCESILHSVGRGVAVFSGTMGVMVAYMLTLSRFVLYPHQHNPHHLTLAGSLYSDLLWYAVVGLPVFGGVWMGWTASRRAAFGAFFALTILTLFSAPCVWLESSGRLAALPYLVLLAISTAAHFFALWLPIGGVATLLTQVAKQYHSRRFAGARPKRVS